MIVLVLVFCVGIAIVGLPLVDAALKGELGWPDWWEIPAGKRGWVAIQYANPACFPILRSGIFRVITVDSNGMACTSDGPDHKWRYHLFVAPTPNGGREFISYAWAHGSESPEGVFDAWFLGTKEKLKRAGYT
jgi:hypothetical protein